MVYYLNVALGKYIILQMKWIQDGIYNIIYDQVYFLAIAGAFDLPCTIM